MKIKNNILKYRKKAGLTLEEVGRIVGISKSNVHNFQSGSREPKLSKARDIASALWCTVDEIWPVE